MVDIPWSSMKYTYKITYKVAIIISYKQTEQTNEIDTYYTFLK